MEGREEGKVDCGISGRIEVLLYGLCGDVSASVDVLGTRFLLLWDTCGE